MFVYDLHFANFVGQRKTTKISRTKLVLSLDQTLLYLPLDRFYILILASRFFVVKVKVSPL